MLLKVYLVTANASQRYHYDHNYDHHNYGVAPDITPLNAHMFF